MIPVQIQSVDESTRVITTVKDHGFATGNVLGITCNPGSSFPAPDQMYWSHVLSDQTLTLHTSAADAATGSDPVELVAFYAAEMGLERLSIKERLERGIMSVLASLPDVAQVRRPSIEDEPLGDRVIVLTPDDEQATINTWPFVTMDVTFLAQVHLHPRGDDTTPHLTLSNRWIAIVEQAIASQLCGNRFGLPLNITAIEITGTESIYLSGDISELVCGVEFLVSYRHRIDDPYTEN